jgi:hypothetical protein
MSLYNLAFGWNRYAMFHMAALGLQPAQVGRFRDAYLHRGEGGGLEIHVYTRNGGGNRPDHTEVTERLRRHPLYLRDFDDATDSTYASYAFRVPEILSVALDDMAEKDPDALPPSHKERLLAFLEKMKQDPEAPEVKSVTDKLRPILLEIDKG